MPRPKAPCRQRQGPERQIDLRLRCQTIAIDDAQIFAGIGANTGIIGVADQSHPILRDAVVPMGGIEEIDFAGFVTATHLKTGRAGAFIVRQGSGSIVPFFGRDAGAPATVDVAILDAGWRGRVLHRRLRLDSSAA